VEVRAHRGRTHTQYTALYLAPSRAVDDKDVCRLDFDESLDLDIWAVKPIFNHFFFQQFWVLSLRLIVIKQIM